MSTHEELPNDLVEAAGFPPGAGTAKRAYDPRLTNEDLAPLKEQTWTSYNIFAFWMSDVHSVGGYVTAGALFALGISVWQVFLALIIGIVIIQFIANKVAKPSQEAGVPYPVICRASFGVLGANIPAIIRGLIAVAWYGVQTFLAAGSLNIVLLKVFPGLSSIAGNDTSFLGLSYLGYISFAILWVAQAALFMRGMESIRRFIDFAGPAVYLVMLALCAYMLKESGFDISMNLSSKPLHGIDILWAFLGAIATVVAYFAGPTLNFGDFSRYAKSMDAVRKGNLLGLPINFTFFSILTVVTAAATVPVFGELITDPVVTVQKIDTWAAVLLGGLTFVTATVGINIVANFISPAFDFSHVNPQKISWRMGGMIAAVGSVILTPWNWYDNNTAILFTVGLLGALIGPLFGILLADYYIVRKQKVDVDDLYTLDPEGQYHYSGGYNPAAVYTVIVAGVISILCATVTQLPAVFGTDSGLMKALSHTEWVGHYSWFIGCGVGFVLYLVYAAKYKVAGYSKVSVTS